MKRITSTKSNLFISHYLTSLEGLIQLADNAAALHHVELLSQTAHSLSRLGLDEAGVFYQALADGRSQANVARSSGNLSELSEHASPHWQAKAMVALGSNAFETGDNSAAQYYYTEARRLSGDDLIRLHVQEMTAQILSRDGNHRQALKSLLESLPRAQGIHRLNHLNSLAVVLNDLGRVDEAKHILAPCLASPYRIFYPEWKETNIEINSVTRSRVYKPALQPDRISARVTRIDRALMDKNKVLRFIQPKMTNPQTVCRQRRLMATVEEGLTRAEYLFVTEKLVKGLIEYKPSLEDVEILNAILEEFFREVEKNKPA
jgi:tetratricopeptide (TPR) repeat protein